MSLYILGAGPISTRLAATSFYVIERPSIRLGRRITHRRPTLVAPPGAEPA